MGSSISPSLVCMSCLNSQFATFGSRASDLVRCVTLAWHQSSRHVPLVCMQSHLPHVFTSTHVICSNVTCGGCRLHRSTCFWLSKALLLYMHWRCHSGVGQHWIYGHCFIVQLQQQQAISVLFEALKPTQLNTLVRLEQHCMKLQPVERIQQVIAPL